jgi:hypothetical protein
MPLLHAGPEVLDFPEHSKPKPLRGRLGHLRQARIPYARRPGGDEPRDRRRGSIPESEGDDDGEKRRDFQSFPSLQAYILVHQDSRAVRVYRRDERGEWRLGSDVYTNGETIQLPCLSAPIAVDEIYRDILDADGRSLLR